MVDTRSSESEPLPCDSEIERTISHLRRLVIAESEPQSENLSGSLIEAAHSMAGRRTIDERKAPNLDQQPLCITFPTLEAGTTFELKTGLIHLLPSFHGMKSEDPNKHLSEFHLVCSGMQPHEVSEEHLYLRAFPFSLKDAAKDWLHYLPPASISSWAELKKAFLEKYFPATVSSSLKKAISNIAQLEGETFPEYWGRFKKMVASCPYHGYDKDDLILYFTDGLNEEDARLVISSCGGNINNKTHEEAERLLSELAENPKIFNKRSMRKVHAAGSNSSSSALEAKVANLTSLLLEFVINSKITSARVCEICTSSGHPTD